ncbi:hypothetical protein LTR33_009563 [Friedmanniomyces endolithicus]|nr:hypothetical protein LTR33_009563 [Friedmanniomyces endolithicus]
MPSFTVFKGSKDGSIQQSETKKNDLTGDQVLLKVTASGLCGTDMHYRTSDMVLGHEGVGIVESLGPDTKYLKKGDRVGWGYEHDSCGHCEQCLKGSETYCAERAMYGYADLDQGSFAKGAVWREAFLFKIPDNLPDEAAAPLQCGGATVFNALHSYGSWVVVVLSGSDRKKDEAMKLGAHEFVATKGAKELKVSQPLNRLLVTTSVMPQWDLIMPIMASGATIHRLSVDEGNFTIPNMSLILNGITVQGSVVASRYVHNRMLEFAALHNIQPIVEKFPMTKEGIEEGMAKLDKGEMRYRGVFVAE